MSTSMTLYCISHSEDNFSALESMELLFPKSDYLLRLLKSKLLIHDAQFSEAEILLNSIYLETFQNQNWAVQASTLLLLGYVYWRKGNQKEIDFILDKACKVIERHIPKDGVLFDWLMSLYFNLIGNYNFDISDDSDKIFQAYNSALLIHKKYHNRQELARALNNVGIAYYRMGKLDLALSYYNESLKENQSIKFSKDISANLLNIGEIHMKRGQLTLALNYFEDSLKESEKRKDLRSWATRYIYISKVYMLWGDYNIALEYLTLALRLFTDLHNEYQLALINTQLGKVHLYLEEFEQSKEYFAKSLSYLLNQTTNDFELSETLCYLIDLNNRINQPRIADRYFDLLQQISKNSTNPHVNIRADLASIVIKKDQERLSSLVQSLDRLEKLISAKSIDYFITYDALVKYTEILLKELEILENLDLDPLIGSLITQIQSFGENESVVRYYIASQILRSRFQWVKGEKENAIELLSKIREFILNKELNHEITRIDRLFDEYRFYYQKINSGGNGQFQSQLEQYKIIDYLESIQNLDEK